MTDFDARHYWDERFTREWSLHSVGMLRLAHSYNRWMYRIRRDGFRRTVRELRLDLADSDILDIGSGTGFYVNLWRRFGAGRVTGMDLADSAVARLRKRYSDVHFERGDISGERPFDKETFDVVSAFDILFHIVDDDGYRRAFANVHDMLRPSGTFVFTEHFPRGNRKGGGHHVSRPLGEIENILHETGFEIVSRRPVFVLMSWPVGTTRPWRASLWSKRMVPLIKNERWGNVVGAALFPIEALLTRIMPESDATEIMVCRKTTGPDATTTSTGAPGASGVSALTRAREAGGRVRRRGGRALGRRSGESVPHAVVRRGAGLLSKAGLTVVDIAPGTVLLSRKSTVGRSGSSTRRPFVVSKPDGLGPVVTKKSATVRSLARGAAIARKPDIADQNTFEIHKALFKEMTTEHVVDLLRTYEVDCVLDVGANKGQYARSLRKAGYTGHIISFEPVPETVEHLQRAAAKDPRWTVQHCALGREDTTMPMNVVYGTMSSLLPPSDYGNTRYKRFKNIDSVDVPVRRLEGMLDEILPSGIERPRLYLKLDTQGYDVEAFAGLGQRVQDLVGMQSEVAVLRIYEGMPRLTEAISIYEESGLEITGMFPVTRETSTGRVLEFDCVMARAAALKTGND